MNLALFDLDHTLIPIDSDYEWGQFLTRIGAVDRAAFEQRNADFFAQYQAGTLDPVEYLEFALGTLAQFPRQQLDDWHAQFMAEVIHPVIKPVALRSGETASGCGRSGCHHHRHQPLRDRPDCHRVRRADT